MSQICTTNAPTSPRSLGPNQVQQMHQFPTVAVPCAPAVKRRARIVARWGWVKENERNTWRWSKQNIHEIWKSSCKLTRNVDLMGVASSVFNEFEVTTEHVETCVPWSPATLCLIHVIKGNFMEETPSYGLSHSHQPKDHCVQLAPALRNHEVTFLLTKDQV